jgi:phenylpyruvate tautomerase PptA (4-oxalocrotonate tautomerase family)
MPLVDVRIVSATPAPPGLAQAIADALGAVLHAGPGTLWVRLDRIDPAHYAENAGAPPAEGPVFVCITRARLSDAGALAAEAAALTQAVAAAAGRAPQHVHIEFAPPAAGRMAFGGQLVR